MKNKELAVVNIILFIILFVFGAVSLGTQNSTQVFSQNEQPIYKADTEQKSISLMCNVYWGTEYVEPYLEVLKQNKAKATFFIGGSWAVENPELVEMIYSQGHEIANHGYSHKLASKHSVEDIKQELIKTDQILLKICNRKPSLYAPPSGDFTKETVDMAVKNGYNTIMWTIDTIDWRDHDSNKISKRIINNVKPGAFVLTHPTQDTIKALEEVLPKLTKQGYTFNTVSELLKM